VSSAISSAAKGKDRRPKLTPSPYEYGTPMPPELTTRLIKSPAMDPRPCVGTNLPFRVAAWFCASTIVVLSIVSPQYRPITPLPLPLEHLSIAFLAGSAFSLGYPSHHKVQFVALVAFLAAVELMQVWVPGRHARLSDFVAGVLGLGVGISLTHVLTRLARR
jgi:hypothetical protein